MPDLYPNLPGVVVDLVEQKKAVPVTQRGGLTRSLLILGTASDGPLNTPISFASPDDAESVFGKAQLDGIGRPNLTRAAYEAYLAGVRDIRLMKITGAYATAALECAAEQRAVESSAVGEVLGIQLGNDETVIRCEVDSEQDEIVVVTVSADGEELPGPVEGFEEGFYTIGAIEPVVGEGKPGFDVTVKSGCVRRGATISIYYVYQHGENGIPKSESGIAAGDSQEFPLVNVPVSDSFVLYSDGEIISEEGYELQFDTEGNSCAVLLKSGYGDVGSTITSDYDWIGVLSYTPTIELCSKGAASLYNDVTVEVQGVELGTPPVLVAKKIIITKPADKKMFSSEPSLEYDTKDYSTLAALVNAINSDPRNNVVVADTQSPSKMSFYLCITDGPQNLQGGDDGLGYSYEQIYQALGGIRDSRGDVIQDGAYTLLENYEVDNIVLAGIYADAGSDDIHGRRYDFAGQLAQFCAVSSMLNSNVLGFIGVRPIANPTLSEIARRSKILEQTPHEYYMHNIMGEIMRDSDGEPISISKYISICSYPDLVVTHPRFGRYVADPAIYYAGLAASLPGDQGTTHVSMPNVQLRYELSNLIRDRLVGAQYVTFETGSRGPIVTVGCTAAKLGSDYDSLMTMKVAHTATELVRSVSEPYIGRAYGAAVRAAHTQAIQDALTALVKRGSLADFQFDIVLRQIGRNTRRAAVNMALTTAGELRKVHLFVNLTPEAD